MSLTLLIGGARSGKSALAVEMGRRFAARSETPVTFVATAPSSDDDMAQRIARHAAERPASWSTVEEQSDLVRVLETAPHGMLIVDCLTLWTSNLMFMECSDDDIRDRASLAATIAAERSGQVVVVTNEVGLGIVPDNDMARRYRDLHGWVNQQWARAAHMALHLVAGRAMPLQDPWTLLGDTFLDDTFLDDTFLDDTFLDDTFLKDLNQHGPDE
jgi:adenosyl cobinamide kinase/adenosyl cobinamide phosphate guanylyltransferase